MTKATSAMPALSRLAKAAVALEVVLSVGALSGGLVLVAAPRGEILPLPLSALTGSPFDSYLVPGLILFTVIGLGPLVAARLAWIRHELAALAAVAVGLALLIWVAVEVAILTTVALGWVAKAGLPALHRPRAGQA